MGDERGDKNIDNYPNFWELLEETPKLRSKTPMSKVNLAWDESTSNFMGKDLSIIPL